MRRIKKSKIKQKVNYTTNLGGALNIVTDDSIRALHTKLSLIILGVSAIVLGVALCL